MTVRVIDHHNHYGNVQIPLLGIKLEQLIIILYPTLLIPAVLLWYIQLSRQRKAAVTPAGCYRLGLSTTTPSNLADQYQSNYDEGTEDQAQWKVKAIHIHPIKSCAAVELAEADIDATGMTWDRKFVFAEQIPQKSNGKDQETSFKWTSRTQRTPGFEKFALVKPEVWLPSNTKSENPDLRSSPLTHLVDYSHTGALLVRYPYIPTGPLAWLDKLFLQWNLIPFESTFIVPLVPPSKHTYSKESVELWKDSPVWLNYAKHVPDEFQQYLGTKYKLTLFRVDPDSYREVYRNAPRKAELGYQPIVGAADAYPLHLLNLASVHDVGNRIKDAIPQFSAQRFRSNILLTGPKAYDEDDWKRIKITSPGGESHDYYCACHTVRCRLPNVDPDTSHRHPVEPDKTLKSFRCIDEGDSKNACLGLQIVPANTTAKEKKVIVRVGDTVEVLERGEHLYIRQGH